MPAACHEARQTAGGEGVEQRVHFRFSLGSLLCGRAMDGVARSGPDPSDASATKCARTAATSPPNAFSRNERPSWCMHLLAGDDSPVDVPRSVDVVRERPFSTSRAKSVRIVL